MGNYQSTKTEVMNYIRARTPLIIVNSSERERVESLLLEIAEQFGIEICYYTDSKQVCSFNNNTARHDVDNDPLPYIAEFFKKKRCGTFALGDAKRLGEDNLYTRELLNILYLARENSGTLILITPDPVWSRLMQFGMITSLSYPDIDERIELLGAFLQTYQGRFPIEWESEDILRAATLLRGFSKIQIENILSATLITNQGLSKAKIHTLTSQKNKLYASVPSIQLVPIKSTLEVSGLGALKAWLREKKSVFFALDDELKRRDLQTPKGILLAGIPGCGKSYSAKMIAKEWELPLFRFDIGSVYNKWVGESEKKMREALQFIDNVAPCILWIDEIERALSVSDIGNDTGKRVLGEFLFWLQESNSRIFLVATANDITLLPAELFRKGRFSEVFFINLPNLEERKEAINQYCCRSLHMKLSEDAIDELAAISSGFSYSDIEYAIKDAAQVALVKGQWSVTEELIKEKFQAVIPISKSNPELVTRIQNWGRERASLASLTSREVEVFG